MTPAYLSCQYEAEIDIQLLHVHVGMKWNMLIIIFATMTHSNWKMPITMPLTHVLVHTYVINCFIFVLITAIVFCSIFFILCFIVWVLRLQLMLELWLGQGLSWQVCSGISGSRSGGGDGDSTSSRCGSSSPIWSVWSRMELYMFNDYIIPTYHPLCCHLKQEKNEIL